MIPSKRTSEQVEKHKIHIDTPTKSYFDTLSTTQLDPRVLDAMLPYATSFYGNPHSRNHTFGWNAENALDKSRKQVADLINADPKEIIFTSGATESDNLALKGVAEFYNNDLHIITTQTEHKAVLESCRALEEKGVEITYLPIEKDGSISLEKLRDAITPKTKLISIMAVNNEIGVINPLEDIGKICAEHDILFHSDGAQGVGKIPVDVKKCNIALLSISGHKIYGPKGVGALYVRRRPRVRLIPQATGGGQERGLRSGTTPPFLVAGLGRAAEIAGEEMARDEQHIRSLNEKLVNYLEENLGDGFIKNGSNTIPGCLNLSFPYVEGEGLLMKLKDFALSSGSACTSASLEPSYVLRAIGASDDLAHSSIRFGIGRFTDEKEVDKLAKATVKAVKELREMSPLYEMVKEGLDLNSIKWSA
ncbi:cysteine desulfurase [Pancytospora epiphaga]|nr:cysteine desulfurase [Pancytospora epiphaga]